MRVIRFMVIELFKKSVKAPASIIVEVEQYLKQMKVGLMQLTGLAEAEFIEVECIVLVKQEHFVVEKQ
jgi:hypothetical protein